MKKSRYIYLTLAIIITVFIFSQSIMPGALSSEQSGFFTNIINNVLISLNINLEKDTLSFLVRKFAHFSEFFFFGFFWFMFFKSFNYSYTTYIITLNYGLMAGITDELIQNLVPGRAMQGIDVLIDLSGVAFFLLVAFIIIKLTEKRTR